MNTSKKIAPRNGKHRKVIKTSKATETIEDSGEPVKPVKKVSKSKYVVDGVYNQKQYYQDNRDRLLERRKKCMTCECGSVVKLDYYNKHKKKPIHIRRLEHLEKNNEEV